MNTGKRIPATPAPQTIELIRRLLEAAHRPEPANDPTICAICGAPLTDTTSSICPRLPGTRKGLVSMHTTWANDPVNSPNHYTRSHPGMECIELTADTSFCLGNAIKYLWRYHGKGRPVEDLEKARWYLCRVIDHDEKIAWTRQQHAILDTLANDPTIPDAEAHTWAKLRQGFPDSALACLDRLIEHERNQQ